MVWPILETFIKTSAENHNKIHGGKFEVKIGYFMKPARKV